MTTHHDKNLAGQTLNTLARATTSGVTDRALGYVMQWKATYKTISS